MKSVVFKSETLEVSILIGSGLLVEYVGTGGMTVLQGDGERIWNMWFGGMPITEKVFTERLKKYQSLNDSLSWNVQDESTICVLLTEFISKF